MGASANGFAWGVLIGAALGPFALPLVGCMRSKMRWYPIFSFANPDLKTYLWLSFPIMIGFSIVVVDEWIVKNQASYLSAGALSYLQYGRTLMKVPIGVFGMAIGVASYPTISRMVAAGGVVEAYGTLAHAVRLTLFVTFAAQICLTLAGFEATYLIWGFLSHRFSTADAEARPARYWHSFRSVSLVGRRKPSSTAAFMRLEALGCLPLSVRPSHSVLCLSTLCSGTSTVRSVWQLQAQSQSSSMCCCWAGYNTDGSAAKPPPERTALIASTACLAQRCAWPWHALSPSL